MTRPIQLITSDTSETDPKRSIRKKRNAPSLAESSSDNSLNAVNGLVPALPEAAPLSMPVQQGARLSALSMRLSVSQYIALISWRLVMAATTFLLTGLFAYEFYMVLSLKSITPAQIVLLTLCVISFTWVAFGTATSLCGFLASLFGAFRRDEMLDIETIPKQLAGRTALLFPIYHENPMRIAATIQAIAEECDGLGFSRNFDFFVLSDTRTETAKKVEATTFSALSKQLLKLMPVYYRWRQDNHGKKAGNIAEWVRNHGGGYDHFVIFDADSIMSGETLARLSAAMERNPNAGLIQTVPRLVGGTSVIARLQQFAARVYGPLLAKGSALWHGQDSNYWGHNAIIRCRAFAASAGLPELKGRPPFGGTIQSHDFIEAAFMRRAGWGVHLLPDLEGSYEGCPPGINEIIVRDRRWCQGNLQHARLLAWPDLKLVSRLHLVTGIMSYMASLFWLLALMAGLVTAYQWAGYQHSYFPNEVVLFPNWPVMDSERAMTLMVFTAIVVLLPKILGLVHALFIDRAWARTGSRLKIIPGFITEVTLSALIAPIFMLAHVGALFNLFIGRDSGWGAQGREGERLPLSQAMVQFAGYSAVGLSLMAYCFFVSPVLIGWLSLVYAGLVMAPVLAWMMGLNSSTLFFDWLMIPEERKPRAVLLKCDAIHKRMIGQETSDKAEASLALSLSGAGKRHEHLRSA
ncbi:MAG: glucans biosynthesis glucosyltransferase H [Rhodomicrobium sp.]|nr:MAG: glucans biosynthesis glucosyltransferase H [Rhodomicrobium sp.]